MFYYCHVFVYDTPLFVYYCLIKIFVMVDSGHYCKYLMKTIIFQYGQYGTTAGLGPTPNFAMAMEDTFQSMNFARTLVMSGLI